MTVCDRDERIKQLMESHAYDMNDKIHNLHDLQTRLEEANIALAAADERARLGMNEHERGSPIKESRMYILEMENRDLSNKVI